MKTSKRQYLTYLGCLNLAPGSALGTPVLLGPAWEELQGLKRAGGTLLRRLMAGGVVVEARKSVEKMLPKTKQKSDNQLISLVRL